MFETLLGKSLQLKDYIKFKLQNKPKFNGLLTAIQVEINYLLYQMEEFIYVYDIDRLYSSDLDFIGVIVGQERITTSFSNNNFVFDSSQSGFDAGVFDAGGELISDEQYKFLIKAKIVKDNTKYWAREDIINYHQVLLGTDDIFSVEEDTLEVKIIFENPLDDFKKQALNTYGMEISGVNIIYEVPL